jgi:NAD+ synthase
MIKHNDLNWTIEPSIETDKIIKWLKDYFSTGSEVGAKAVIGMSGGKDSTIAAALLAQAIGSERVVGVIMPNGEMKDKELAIEICSHLGIMYTIIDIQCIFGNFIHVFNQWDDPNDVVINNTPPRIRMAMLYAVAATCHGRVVNTCNKSESYIGWETKWGDNVGDFSIFHEFPVRWVKMIGHELCERGIIKHEWVDKIPDDGLCGQTDEDKFGFTYEQLDDYIINCPSNIDIDTLTSINQMVSRSEHKRNVVLPHPYIKTRHREGTEFDEKSLEDYLW